MNTDKRVRLWRRPGRDGPRRWVWRKMERPPLDWNGRYDLPPPSSARPGRRVSGPLPSEGKPSGEGSMDALRREILCLREENAALQKVVRILSRAGE